MSGEWSFTFTDMRSGEELAQLPLTKVKYGREVSGAGKLSAYLGLTDPKVRAQNPWRATRQRRTSVYAERDDGMCWSGPVIVRERSSDSQGFTLSAVTWESWLHAQLLIADLTLLNQPIPVALQAFVDRAQTVTDVRIDVEANASTTGLISGRYYAREIKPILELIDNLGIENGVSFEYRIDGYRDAATGALRQVLRYGEPRIGRRYEDTRHTFAYPDGGLIFWNLVEDGSGAHNVLSLLGAGSGALQPFDVVQDIELGIDEIESGYPSWMGDFRAQDTGDMTIIWRRAEAAMRASIASEYVFSGVRLDPDAYLGAVEIGDDIALEIAHMTLEEWPEPTTYLTRVLAENVVVGDGGAADQVSVTIGGLP